MSVPVLRKCEGKGRWGTQIKKLILKKNIKILPGHGPLLQSWVSESVSNGHGKPPFLGGLQLLVLDCVPAPPQATEHSLQSLHSDQSKFLVDGPI